MSTIVTRSGKGYPLTWDEMDTNLTNLNYGSFTSVKDSSFGAVGDGITDDTAAIQAALNSTATVISGNGKTYKITSQLTGTKSNQVLTDIILDASSITAANAIVFYATGSSGTPVSLTSNSLANTRTITVADTSSFVVDGYYWLSSNTVFCTTQTVLLGQYVKIKTIVSPTQLTTYDLILYDFNTANSAVISKITPLTKLKFSNVKVIGANNSNNQIGFYFDKCADVLVDNCHFTYLDNSAVIFDRCINGSATQSSFRYSKGTEAYGVGIYNGSYGTSVTSCFGEDLRHLVAVGDNDGVNLFTNVTGNRTTNMRSAGIDSHPASDYMTISNNIIDIYELDHEDGIIFQGLNCVIESNIIIGNSVLGIRHQLLPNLGPGSSVISNNSINRGGNTPVTDVGIYVLNQTGGSGLATLDSVIVSNNVIDNTAEIGIYVYALNGPIKNVVISGNTLKNNIDTPLYLRTTSTFVIDKFTITGNIFNCGLTRSVLLSGLTTAKIKNGTITGNVFNGGTYGTSHIYTDNVTETGNIFTSPTISTSVDANSKNLFLDRTKELIVTYSSDITYTIPATLEQLILNRAATVTVTLPDPTFWPARKLSIKTIQAQTVVSASSNVVPLAGGAAGTAILPAVAGSWASLISDGTNWIIEAS